MKVVKERLGVGWVRWRQMIDSRLKVFLHLCVFFLYLYGKKYRRTQCQKRKHLTFYLKCDLQCVITFPRTALVKGFCAWRRQSSFRHDGNPYWATGCPHLDYSCTPALHSCVCVKSARGAVVGEYRSVFSPRETY